MRVVLTWLLLLVITATVVLNFVIKPRIESELKAALKPMAITFESSSVQFGLEGIDLRIHGVSFNTNYLPLKAAEPVKATIPYDWSRTENISVPLPERWLVTSDKRIGYQLSVQEGVLNISRPDGEPLFGECKLAADCYSMRVHATSSSLLNPVGEPSFTTGMTSVNVVISNRSYLEYNRVTADVVISDADMMPQQAELSEMPEGYATFYAKQKSLLGSFDYQAHVVANPLWVSKEVNMPVYKWEIDAIKAKNALFSWQAEGEVTFVEEMLPLGELEFTLSPYNEVAQIVGQSLAMKHQLQHPDETPIDEAHFNESFDEAVRSVGVIEEGELKVTLAREPGKTPTVGNSSWLETGIMFGQIEDRAAILAAEEALN